MIEEDRILLESHDLQSGKLWEESLRLHYRRTKLGEEGLEEREAEVKKQINELFTNKAYVSAVLLNKDDTDAETRREMELRINGLLLQPVNSDEEYAAKKRENENRVRDIRYIVGSRNGHEQQLSFGKVVDVLDHDPDRQKREEHWRSLIDLDERVVHGLREQVKRANDATTKAAEQFERPDLETFIDLRYAVSGVTKEEVYALCHALIQRAKKRVPQFLGKVAQSIGVDKIMPWDFYFGKNNYSPNLPHHFPSERVFQKADATVRLLGTELPLKQIIEVIDSKYFGAWTYTFNQSSRTFKVVMNPKRGQLFYGIFFHEIGRVLHRWYLADVRGPSPFTDEPTVFNTALSTLLSQLTSDREWLRTFTSMDEETITKVEELDDLELYVAANRAIMTLFEDQLCRNPDGDLAQMYQDAAGDFNLWPELGKLNNWQIAIGHLVQNHGSLHTYPIGHIIASGLRNHLIEQNGTLLHPGTNGLFQELAEGGSRTPYLEKIKAVTGKEIYEMV